MAKRHKNKLATPDEAFSFGPLTVSRFGKNVIWESNWPEGTFDEFQKRLAERYPKIVEEIDSLVADIANFVSVLPPNQLLQRAWWDMATRFIKIETEAKVGEEEAISVRMVDYVQSVIAAVPPAPDQRDELTDDEWTTLREKVERLFGLLNFDYQHCRTAVRKAENPNLDLEFEAFEVKAQMYWCNIRGDRYQVHEPVYLADMFLPHSDVLEELFGITGERFVAEITKIWHALSFGLQDAVMELKQFQKDSMAAIGERVSALPPGSEPDLPALMAEVVAENGWEDRQARVLGRLFGMDLFDLQKTTTLPAKLLDALAWSPGEELEFFADGKFQGWPLRIWPVFRRPFIKLDGRYYCFDLYSLFDNLYRSMQRLLFRLKPDYAEKWNAIQQSLSENLPFRYLERILPGATTLRQIYYRGETDAGAKGWCEADGLLIYGDHLFVIESRGGAFTYTPPATDFPAYVTSLKNLVLKPARQGSRFVAYLKSADTVALYDQDHKQIGQLRSRDFRHITICTVTIDPFTELAAQVQHLGKVGVNVGPEPIWALSIDDLRVYADIFENPHLFLHYVEQRMRAFESDAIRSEDELDHLGLYLEHNDYRTYAEEFRRATGARVNFLGYRSNIDKFFRERMFDANAPCPLKQEIPPRILEIIDWLSRTTIAGRSELSSYLLNLDGEWRSIVTNAIEDELASQPNTKLPKPFSSHGSGTNLTLYCWSDPWTSRDAKSALEHTQSVLLLNYDKRRLLLELSYAEDGTLRDVAWSWVTPAKIPFQHLPRLREKANTLRDNRVAKAKAERRKIGRNEQCPCGSGKKYKRCCGR